MRRARERARPHGGRATKLHCDNDTMPADDRTYWTRPLPWLVAFTHVVAQALLFGLVDRDSDAIAFFAALPFAQVSLIALWGATAPDPSWLRMPLVVAGVVAVSFSFTDHFQRNFDAGEAAATFLMFATQGLLVVAAIVLARVCRFVFRRRRAEATPDAARPLRYGLRTLILWTTMLAVFLAAGRALFASLGWTSVELEREELTLLPLIGGFNALVALLVAITLWRRNTWALRMLGGFALATLAGVGMYFVAALLFPPDERPPWPFLIAWALGHALILYATLLPLGWSLAGDVSASSAAPQSADALPGGGANQLAANP